MRKLVETVYPHVPAETDRYRALAKDAQTTLSQVQRIVKGQIGTSVDYVEWIATALGVSAHQLLIPHFAERAKLNDDSTPTGKARSNAA